MTKFYVVDDRDGRFNVRIVYADSMAEIISAIHPYEGFYTEAEYRELTGEARMKAMMHHPRAFYQTLDV